MQAIQTMPAQKPAAGALAVGFGITVAMWGVGYLGRLPALMLPSPLMLFLLLGCPPVGGWLLGRTTGTGWRSGAVAGAISGLINLLVLGSFLGGATPDQIVPSALLWIPGSLVISAGLAALGAGIGSRGPAAQPAQRNWLSIFVRVAIAATLFLLAVGGLVTSAEAGLAVDDWPTSFGYNMFLYPLSRMTGGIYYEHAHRLFGALVGLTTLVLAVFLQRVDSRRWVRTLGWVALGMVIVQGMLGGIRVTERSIALALTHGVLGQVFLAMLVALGAFTSATWLGDSAPLRRPTARTDRLLGGMLVGIVIVQLVLGAAQRHTDNLLVPHVLVGLAFVAPLAIHVGVRSWGLNEGQPLLQRLGLALVGAICVQLMLGLGALVVTVAAKDGTLSRSWDLVIATTHQWFGACVFALSVVLLTLSFRLLAPGPGDEPGRVDPPTV
ncbi:MAG: hypothetical protein GY716_10145 [bacterium]|nr:hypothetical protein [bacterium]